MKKTHLIVFLKNYTYEKVNIIPEEEYPQLKHGH